MGIVYDRNKRAPEKGPKIYIKYKDKGRWQYRPIGHINPDGLTKVQLQKKERELRKLAADVLTKIEGDIVAGRYGLEDHSKPEVVEPLFSEVGTDWVNQRKAANEKDPTVHRAWRDDQSRMEQHLKPFFQGKTIAAIGTAEVAAFIAEKRGKLSRQTIVNCLNIISRLYNDLREQGAKVVNPVALLDRATRRAIGAKRDPRTTPYLRKKTEIRAMHLALEEPVQVMFDLGVFGGLRTGEILALEVDDVELARRRITVSRSVDGPVKDDDVRVVPILDTLFPVLRTWLLKRGDGPLLFPPTKGRGKYMRYHTLHKHLRTALKSCELPVALTWYQCTRHTFASHWVMDGRPIEKLQQILGHSSVTVTERYAHLNPEMFDRNDLAALAVDLSEPVVLPLRARKGGQKG